MQFLSLGAANSVAQMKFLLDLMVVAILVLHVGGLTILKRVQTTGLEHG